MEKKLENGWIKINTNGSFDYNTKQAGERIIARDSNSVVIDGEGKSLVAELQVVYLGLKFVVKKNLDKVIIETDSEVVFDDEVTNKEKRKIWHIYRRLSKDFNILKFNFDQKRN